MATLKNALLMTSGGSGWSIDTFLDTLGDALHKWGALIVFIIGTVMVIASVYFIAKGLLSQGRGQTNWAVTILMLILGGVFMSTSLGGWDWLKDVSSGAKQTMDDLGNGTTKYPNAGNTVGQGNTIVFPQMKGMFF